MSAIFFQNREFTEDNIVHRHSICIEMKSISAHCGLEYVCAFVKGLVGGSIMHITWLCSLVPTIS